MPTTKTKRYWCSRCKSYQEFKITSAMVRAGDNGTMCEGTVWSCCGCGFVPFLPPTPEEEGNEQGNTSNS